MSAQGLCFSCSVLEPSARVTAGPWGTVPAVPCPLGSTRHGECASQPRAEAGLGPGYVVAEKSIKKKSSESAPGPWPSLVKRQGETVFVVLFLVLVSRCALLVWIRMVTRVIFPQENNPSPKQSWSRPFGHSAWMAFCLSVLRWSSTAALGWEGRAALSQSTAEARPPSVARSFPFSSFMSRLAPGWGRPEIFVQTFKIRHIGYPAFPVSLLPRIPNRVMLRNASSLEIKTDRLPVFLEQLILLACYYSPSAIFKLWHKTREKKRLKFWPVRYPDTWDAVLIWEYLYHKDFLGGFRDPSVNK